VIELVEDFKDLLIELADAEADFVLIGGYAVAFHGHPRGTKDLDVLVRATVSNAQKVYKALAAFGAPLDQFKVSEADFSDYEGILQIGLASTAHRHSQPSRRDNLRSSDQKRRQL
jgi:hypothetical protein